MKLLSNRSLILLNPRHTLQKYRVIARTIFQHYDTAEIRRVSKAVSSVLIGYPSCGRRAVDRSIHSGAFIYFLRKPKDYLLALTCGAHTVGKRPEIVVVDHGSTWSLTTGSQITIRRRFQNEPVNNPVDGPSDGTAEIYARHVFAVFRERSSERPDG